MKIVNLCISASYINGYSYQENLLTDYFIYKNLETVVICSSRFPKFANLPKLKSGIYYEEKKKIIRIDCIHLSNDLVFTFGLYRRLKLERPEVIFHHNLNISAIVITFIYKIFHSDVTILADNHADMINCNKNKIWQFLYYKKLMRFSLKIFGMSIKKYYGVSLSRCDFLNDMFKIELSKIDFLPIGADTIEADKIIDGKNDLRIQFNLEQKKIIFISGGKMGIDKGTDKLIEYLNYISITNKNIILILFGFFNDKVTENLVNKFDFVRYIGWCDHKKILKYLKLSDFAVWPVHHTTLIEDAIAVKTPIIIKKTRTTEHLINGNGFFIEDDGENTLYNKLLLAINTNIDFKNGCEEMRNLLSYEKLVNKVLCDIEI